MLQTQNACPIIEEYTGWGTIATSKHPSIHEMGQLSDGVIFHDEQVVYSSEGYCEVHASVQNKMGT